MAKIRQTVCYWCFNRDDLPFLKLCHEAKRIGYEGFEMVPEDHWPVLQHVGLKLVTTMGHGTISEGLNRAENHPRIQQELQAAIDKAAANGIGNLICFSGNRAGISEDDGLKNTIAGLKLVTGYAEQKNVTLLLELLNSRVDHRDYQCDRIYWGATAIKQVGSPRVRLLCDIYHMQVMEGDLIRNIAGYMDTIGHFHVAGNPGRNDPDASQEVNYPAIMKTIAASSFAGCIGQEFVPKGDPIASLEAAFTICNAG